MTPYLGGVSPFVKDTPMPRNGSGVYSLPSGSLVSNGDTSDATDLNTPLEDIQADLNAARPIVAGGTGATSAANARTELGVPGLAGNNTFAGDNTFTGTTNATTLQQGGNRVALEVISRTVTSGGPANIAVSWDNANYDTIEIHVQNMVPATDLSVFRLLTDSAGGASFDTGASDYGFRLFTRQLGATESPTTAGNTANRIDLTGAVGSDVNEGGVSMTITIRNAGVATCHTNIDWVGEYNTGVASTKARVEGSGTRNVAAIVNAVRLYFGAGDIRNDAIVTVYGYRK